MKPLTVEWVEKAEGDYATARREIAVQQMPNYDAVCFHAQQTAEKYLKAFLQEQGVAPPRTHSLIELLDECSTLDHRFATLRPAAAILNPYAISARYPGYWAGQVEAREALHACDEVRAFSRGLLGL
jgi:HEPN domain-containing protein